MPCDRLLLAQQRAAHGLGGMRREHGLDEQPPDDLLHVREAQARLLQPLQRIEKSVRLRRARVAQVGAPAPDPVHLLGHVDHLEVGRERADEVARRARRELRQHVAQIADRLALAFAVGDRRAPRRLDEIEQRLAALLADELTDELPEPVHVLAKRLILLREEDVRPQRRICIRRAHSILPAPIGSARGPF